MFVLGGTASNGIDVHLARILGADLGKVQTTKFPDGEIKVRIPEISDGKIVVVQSTCYPQEKNLFELLLTAHALMERRADVTAVIPYLAYARQNKSFNHGEAVSVDLVMDMLKSVGIGSLITVNPHKSGPLMRFGGKINIVNAERTLAGAVKKQLTNPVVLAPDFGGLEIAKAASAVIGCEYTYLDKHRDEYGNVSIRETHGGDLKNKEVVIFDDIISSGGTIELAARYAYSEGASSVSAAGVHLMMVDGAMERLRNAGVEKIFGTNTMPCDKAELVDISEDIAESVRMLARDISI